VLVHVSEPVGHTYPGKEGFALDAFYRFLKAHPALTIIGAHWGGGLPFFASMPELPEVLANVWLDTAASSLLYGAEVYGRVVAAIGAERILFASDYPLLSQARSRRRVEESGLDGGALAAVLGGNACRLLGLV
jgi:predicted TIM-barrel fold metal-dependent hydrolase